jgi:hypothetical protein
MLLRRADHHQEQRGNGWRLSISATEMPSALDAFAIPSFPSTTSDMLRRVISNSPGSGCGCAAGRALKPGQTGLRKAAF